MSESEKPIDELSMSGAAKYIRVGRQAIYKAIASGRLKAEKRRNRWYMTPESLDLYRASKYRRDLKVIDGELVFDLDKGRFSIPQAAKLMAYMLNRPYTEQRLYYKIRYGLLPAKKKGSQWVVDREDLIDLYQKEIGHDKKQMRFA